MPANEIVTVADLARYDESVIRLWIGEGDLATPDFIKQAAWRALAAGETRYSYSQGLPALRTALAAYHHRHWGIEIEPARFCATVGGMNAVVMALQAILEEGDEVIMPSPAWPNAEQAIAIAGGVCVPAAFDFHGDGAITLNLEALFAAVTARTKAIFINSPHNPTGWIMPKADMVRLRDFARERGLWIVADEVYNHFVYDDDKASPAPSFLQFCTPEDRLLVTNTFSKNWCMTGWRAGWLVFPEGLDALFASLCQYNTTGVATFIQRACIAALDGGDAFISEQVERCRASRDILLAGLSALANVTVFAPRGTFYLFFRIEGMNGNSLAMVRDILRQARVGLAPGAAFGRRGDNYLRLCFAIDPELAHAALERLVPFLRQLGSDTATRERTAKFPESVTK
jgi:aspartate/methionine/tyrosine aminotransferase